MNIRHSKHSIRFLTLIVFVLFLNSAFSLLPLRAETEKKPLTFLDMMKFKSIKDPAISEKGDLVAYASQSDRGNGETIAYNIAKRQTFSIPRGSKPVISKNSRWVASTIQPDALESEKAEQKDKLKNGLSILDTTSGKIATVENVKGFFFSDDSEWLGYWLFPDEKKEDKPADDKKKPEEKKDDEEKTETSTLILRHLPSEKETRIEKVSGFAFDPASRFVVYAVLDNDDSKQNRLCIRDLKSSTDIEKKIHFQAEARYSNLTWSKKKSRLGFIFHEKTGAAFSSSLLVWDGAKDKLIEAVSKKRQPMGWVVPNENQLTWTDDENRLFFGFKPNDEYQWTHPKKEKTPPEKVDIYDTAQILEKRGVDVWHWKDPRINPQQKVRWDQLKKEVCLSVYHFDEDRYVQLTNQEMPDISIPENPDYALGSSDRPYQVESTWSDSLRDYYIVNLKNGARQKILTRFPFDASLSFNGRYILYYKDKHWFLYNIRINSTRNLTESIPTPFYDEDYDQPSLVPSYRSAGWTENDQSVILYDKYDVWEFSTSSGEATCLTGGEGRKNKITYRIQRLDPDEKFFKKDQEPILHGFSEEEKFTGIYSLTIGKKGVKTLLQAPDKKFNVREKAKKADKFLFTRENLEEFPDLWVSDFSFKSPEKISDFNKQKENFLWGKSELIEWQSLDGVRLQGIAIKPENYDKTKRYPVLVYFYEIMSNNLRSFNEVTVNHRPNFPFYAGNGYVIFLPDIKYEVGRPGLSSVKCLVPGVQKLISMGIADPKAIALHGHSWSGYQTAYIITQTNMFAAAIAGAAVTNMTSAYNGIRWESGLARQFQYEQNQSRIGPGFSQAPHLYIENSPVFFADRIQTPLLLEFGDKDGAVPWYQGIEMYLQMRRLNKNCILLQYNDEGHWPQKFPNKLDYAMKMKEYLDHYLKGAPAPDWMTKGIPYRQTSAKPSESPQTPTRQRPRR